MRTITNEELRVGVLRALDAKTLQAQCVTKGFLHQKCYYEDNDGCRCAIGTLLTDEEIYRIRNTTHVNYQRVDSDVFRNAAQVLFEDLKYAAAVQRAHDLWFGSKAAHLHAVQNLGPGSAGSYDPCQYPFDYDDTKHEKVFRQVVDGSTEIKP